MYSERFLEECEKEDGEQRGATTVTIHREHEPDDVFIPNLA